MTSDSVVHRTRPYITVATYNLYLGADLLPVFAARTSDELAERAEQAWAAVQRSRPTERLRQAARLLARERPDVIGLQEVALWRVPTPADGATVKGTGAGVPAGTGAGEWPVFLDALAVLLSALADEGADYRAAVQSTNFSSGQLSTAPGGTAGPVAQLTDRSVILVNSDCVTVEQTHTSVFRNALGLELLGQPLRVERGWSGVDVECRGVAVRVVNTHLEAHDHRARSLQAAELVEALGQLPARPTMVLGDLNCRPVLDGSGDAYEVLLESGLSDLWPAVRPGTEPGFTCGQNPDLRNSQSGLDERIDLVLYDAATLRAARAHVFGASPADRTTSGLWPSDHAGVAAALEPLS